MSQPGWQVPSNKFGKVQTCQSSCTNLPKFMHKLAKVHAQSSCTNLPKFMHKVHAQTSKVRAQTLAFTCWRQLARHVFAPAAAATPASSVPALQRPASTPYRTLLTSRDISRASRAHASLSPPPSRLAGTRAVLALSSTNRQKDRFTLNLWVSGLWCPFPAAPRGRFRGRATNSANSLGGQQ